MMTIGAYLAGKILADPTNSAALLAVAPAVRREVKAQLRREWEAYVKGLHEKARLGQMPGCRPTPTGGVRCKGTPRTPR